MNWAGTALAAFACSAHQMGIERRRFGLSHAHDTAFVRAKNHSSPFSSSHLVLNSAQWAPWSLRRLGAWAHGLGL